MTIVAIVVLVILTSAELGSLLGRVVRLADERAGYRESDGARSEVESAGIHEIYVTAKGAHDHVH